MKYRLGYAALFLGVALLGCGDEKTPSEDTSKTPAEESQPIEEDLGPPLAGEPTVEVWSWQDALNAVKKHQGQVVVMHVWATWNENLNDPANQSSKAEREEQAQLLNMYGFDEFVRLKKLYRDDVIAISYNADYNVNLEGQPPESLTDEVMKFVKERGANFQHGVSTIPEEQLYGQLKIVTTPAAFVFDKKGELRQVFQHDENPFSYRKDVIPLVEKLIKEEYTPPAENGNKKENAENGTKEENNAENEKEETKTEQPASDEVGVQMGTWKDLQKKVADARGKVVVVDLWTTQCGPCLKEFPNLVKLHNERQKDVACLSFNMDYFGKGEPEDLKGRVLEVLKKLNSTLPNIMSTEKDEAVYAKIDSYAVPVVEVYDRAGKLRKRFNEDQGEFTYEKDILPLVETLIQEKP